MSGTSRSFITMAGTGLRVAAAPTYYPAHSKNGVNVDQRIVVRAIANIPSKANQGKGEQLGLNVVAWGKLADVLARSMSKGKEFHCELAPNVYKGKVYFKDPDDEGALPVAIQMRTKSGRMVDVMVEKTSYRIKKIVFGEDSDKLIADECRPDNKSPRKAGWNTPGTAAYDAWRAELKRRNEEQYVPGTKQFGQAIVRLIEGPGIGAYDHTKTRQQFVSTATAVKAAVEAQAPAAAPAPAPVAAPSTAVIAGL